MRTHALTAVLAALLAVPGAAVACTEMETAGRIVLSGYEPGQTTIPEDQTEALSSFAEAAADAERVCIIGETDTDDLDETDALTTAQRAVAVRDYLGAEGVANAAMEIAKRPAADAFFGLLGPEEGGRVVVTRN